MIRAAIVTIVVTSVLACLPPSFAASDAELAGFGNKMSSAFRCSIYASMFQDWKEQQRLFQIGLKAGRDFVEGMKGRTDPNPSVGGMLAFVRGVSTDFMVGSMYDSEATKALDEIPLEKRLNPSEEKTEAEAIYRNSNCSSIE
ncbi:MAG: hypothetical protein WAK55_09010 [Xanthobacteraceae bacterium]